MSSTDENAPDSRYLAPEPPDRGESLSAVADERVVHALLRTLAPQEMAATMSRVNRAMDALAAVEDERLALRMRRVVAPWLARGAAAAALLVMAVVITRIAATPSTAYAELAAIASATQSMPLRRYAIVIEHAGDTPDPVRRHGTLDLGPEDRFVVRFAPDPQGVDRGDRRPPAEAILQRLLQDDRLAERLRNDDAFRERLRTDPAFRERILREFAAPRDAGPADGDDRGDRGAGRDAQSRPRGLPPEAQRGDVPSPRDGARRGLLEGGRRGSPGGGVEPPHRLRPPRGRFDPNVSFGSDGERFWMVPAHGPVMTSPSTMLLQSRAELSDGLDHLILDRLIERLRAGYRLEHLELDEVDPETGHVERVVRINAVRVDRADGGRPTPGPTSVTIRARPTDRVVIAFEARWSAPSASAPHRRVALELLEERPPAELHDLAWFTPGAHHSDDRLVIELDEEDLLQLRERRVPRRPGTPDEREVDG